MGGGEWRPSKHLFNQGIWLHTYTLVRFFAKDLFKNIQLIIIQSSLCFWDSIIVLKFPCRKNYLLIKSKRKMDDLFFSALFFLNPISKLILLSNKELQCLRPINLILVFKIVFCIFKSCFYLQLGYNLKN